MTTSVFSTTNDSKNPFLRAFEPANPFATRSDEVAADAPEGSYAYQLIPSGPAVPAEECETTAAAVEVIVRWGTTVLHVAHLTPVRSFWVGEDDGKGKKSDFFLPEEKLGARRLPLVLAGERGVCAVLPAGATGSVTLAGQPARSVRELLAAGAEPCHEAPAAHQVALLAGAKVEIELNGLSFEIAAVNAGRSAGRGTLRGESLPYQGLSLLLHASLLAATALFVPSMAMGAEGEGVSDQQRYEMMAILHTDANPEPAKTEDTIDAEKQGAQGGDPGTSPGHDPGKAGSLSARASNGRLGIPGNGPETYLSRAEALREAQSGFMIGVLNSMNGSLGPTSPWGRGISSGTDPLATNGNPWGDSLGESSGVNGLALSGVGESGVNTGPYIGMDRIGTVGPGGLPGGLEGSHGPGGGRHQPKGPVMRTAPPTTSGQLPADVIQRVVRQNFGRFRACYEVGLRGNPSLAGRVAVRFVIGHDGEVSHVGNGGSDMPDATVVSCVTRAFYGISFPHPENGIVTVTYPIVFSPAN